MISHQRIHIRFGGLAVSTFADNSPVTVKLCGYQKSEQLFIHAGEAGIPKEHDAFLDLALHDSFEVMFKAASRTAAQKQYSLLIVVENQVQDRCRFVLHGYFQGCQEVSICTCVILRFGVLKQGLDLSQERLQQATEQLQGSTLLPLQIDSTDPAAVEAAVRRYAGKPIINSVNGKQQIMDEIFPLVAHYGTNVVGLTLDEGGIPDTAEARFAIAERIVAEAARYGIGPNRILIDCLVMTASTNQRQAEQILRAMSLCKERLGVKCALGVSNISFGLPARPLLGSVFLAAAFGAGLDAPIMNPGSKRFMDTVYSYRVLSVEDEGSTGYIERYAGWTDPYKIAANPAAAQAASTDTVPAAGVTSTDGNDDPIRHMVVSGRKGEIAAETERLLADHDAMDLINNHFIPALDEVGVLFDQGKFFLPQLMASAEAARVGFDTIKRLMPAGEIADKGKICVATVKGDIHDIGKNIVKMLLDNYGYTVFDLGRDVDPQEVLKTVKERDIKLVGLSALMTTTVVAMEETIKLLHAEVPGVKIIVGGAVLTPEYAKQIGADYYAKDAAESARIAEEVFGQ